MARARNTKPKGALEAPLQEFTDELLKQQGLTFIRLPSSLFVSIFANPNIPVHVKAHIKEAIAGLPDNTVLIPIGNGLNLALALELKREIGGGLHGMQKDIDNQIELVVARSQDQVVAAVRAFMAWAQKFITIMKEAEHGGKRE